MITSPPKDGDIAKLLPIIDPDGKIRWLVPYEIMSVNGKLIVDISEQNYLKKIQQKSFYSGKLVDAAHLFGYGLMVHGVGGQKSMEQLQYFTRHFMNVLVDGKLRTTSVTKSLLNVIQKNSDLLCNVKSPHHLMIKVVNKKIGSQDLPTFENSSVVKIDDWMCPVNNPDSGEQWVDFIKSNQQDIFTYCKENSVFQHRNLLIDKFGNDIIGEIITEERQKKLEKLEKFF